MEAFHRFASATIARDASFVALGAAALMVGFSFAPALALGIGGNIALVFAITLLLRAACLSEDRIDRTEAWRILKPQERPVGEAGRRSARDALQEALLRFAKTAAGVAILLYGVSLYISLSAQSRSMHALVSPPYG
jgi:uncharacterized membrane protein